MHIRSVSTVVGFWDLKHSICIVYNAIQCCYNIQSTVRAKRTIHVENLGAAVNARHTVNNQQLNALLDNVVDFSSPKTLNISIGIAYTFQLESLSISIEQRELRKNQPKCDTNSNKTESNATLIYELKLICLESEKHEISRKQFPKKKIVYMNIFLNKFFASKHLLVEKIVNSDQSGVYPFQATEFLKNFEFLS